MRRIHHRRIAALAAGLLLSSSLTGAALLLGGVPASATYPQLNSTGSSFAAVAIQQWVGHFAEIFGGQLNFNVSSSVIGMNDFGCQPTVDIGATDISYATGQADCNTNQVPFPFQYMPDVAGGLAFEYNLTAANGQHVTNLVLDAQTLVGIFTGKITNWNDPSIKALNPGIPFPSQPISAFYRTDPAGENYLLTDYFFHTAPAAMTAFQQLASVNPVGQPSATWAAFPNGIPPQAASLKGVSGSEDAAVGPAQTSGGISYVEYAYAKGEKLPVASIVNASGNAVQPQSYNVAVALTGAILYSDLTQNLGGVYTNTNPQAYPISAYSYFIAQCVPAQAAAQNFQCDSSGAVNMSPQAGAEFSAFIQYVACAGQETMSDLGYSPIPANLVLDDFQAAGRLPGGTTPPPPNAQNCPNPYITGALAPVGQPQVVAQANPGGSDVGTTAGTPGAASSSTARAGTSGSAASNAAANAQAATAAYAAKAAKKAANNPLSAENAFKRQLALQTAAASALLGFSPSEVILWSCLIALVLIGIPVGAWYWQRRRRQGDPA
jgi:ABC-type phosphate transport system substrate-binding protein